MQVFIYEFVTGGGFLGQAEPPPPSLLMEGAAMRAALAHDFVQMGGVTVVTLEDGRSCTPRLDGATTWAVHTPKEMAASLQRLAAEADWTVVIAPEFDGHLATLCAAVLAAGGRLLGPCLPLIQVASDKHLTALRLARAGVPVPRGLAIVPGEPLPRVFPYPAVLKPRDGAGSLDVRLLRAEEAYRGLGPVDVPARLERFCPGQAASVAVLCGPAGQFSLPPCRQHLSDDGCFQYRGGSLPLPPALAARAAALARRAVAALPDAAGYLGVDLILGQEVDGRDDVVIEVNPRLTTSYVGLRAATAPGTNLARAMLDAVEGRTPELCFRPGAIEFDPDGTTRGCEAKWTGLDWTSAVRT